MPQVFQIMNAFDIPVGAVLDVYENDVHYDYTVWTSATDLKNICWAFKTYNDQSIRSVDVRKALAEAGGEVKVIKIVLFWKFLTMITISSKHTERYLTESLALPVSRTLDPISF